MPFQPLQIEVTCHGYRDRGIRAIGDFFDRAEIVKDTFRVEETDRELMVIEIGLRTSAAPLRKRRIISSGSSTAR
jgi:hypothetical protein